MTAPVVVVVDDDVDAGDEPKTAEDIVVADVFEDVDVEDEPLVDDLEGVVFVEVDVDDDEPSADDDLDDVDDVVDAEDEPSADEARWDAVASASRSIGPVPRRFERRSCNMRLSVFRLTWRQVATAASTIRQVSDLKCAHR